MSIATMYIDLSLFTINQKLSIPKKDNQRMKNPVNLVSPLSPSVPFISKVLYRKGII